MFVNKHLEIYTENDVAEAFEKYMDNVHISHRNAGVNYAYGAHNYIFEDKESFENALKYADEYKIYYHYEDYTPERNVLEDYLKYGDSAQGFGGWKCIKNEWGDIEILKDGYLQAMVYFNKEKEAAINTSAFRDSCANEAVLCQTLIENYGDVVLTDEQAKMVTPDTTINLPNGFSVDLAEIDKLYLKLRSSLVSINGRWYEESEIDKTLLSFHKEDRIKGVVLSADKGLKFGKDDNCFYSESAEESIIGDRCQNKVPMNYIRNNLVTALPYIEKAYLVKFNYPNKINITKELTAPFPKGKYIRKYHLEYKLPDGNIYKGFINIEADKEEDLPKMEDVKGSFWAEKIKAGWLGEFTLDDKSAKYRVTNNSVITNGVYRPEDKAPHYNEIHSTAEAETIYQYLQPVDLKGVAVSRFEGRLEDCIKSIETHFFEDRGAVLMNERLNKTKDKDIER